MKIYAQAIRNVNDGISIANVAEGALETLRNISQRQLELAVQSANGIYSLTQRQAMSMEANKLVEEYNRVVQSASFNGITLFGENFDEIRLQAEAGTGNALALNLAADLSRNVGDSGQQDAGLKTTATAVMTLSTGDINSDGNIDLIAQNTPGAQSASLFMGNGDGTFASQGLALPNRATASVVGQVVGGQALDLVFYDMDNGVLKLMQGNGDGTFSAATTIGAGVYSYQIMLDDLNSDGLTDVIDVGTNQLDVFFRTADGTFSPKTTLAKGFSDYTVHSVSIADMDGDGRKDIVASDRNTPALTMWKGQSNGTFSLHTIATPLPTYSVQTGDFNADGISDLAAVDTSNRALVIMGNEDGSFSGARTVTTADFVLDVEVADMNNDGRDDLVFVNPPAGCRLEILSGNGDGTFGAAKQTAMSHALRSGVATTDLNNDGRRDILSWDRGLGITNGIAVSLGTGNRSAIAPYLNLCTKDRALAAIDTINTNIGRIEKQLGTIGSMTSRLAVAVNTLSIARENLTAASARITDADIGEEAANLSRARIVQQAASAVLAHANLQPQIALGLLRNA